MKNKTPNQGIVNNAAACQLPDDYESFTARDSILCPICSSLIVPAGGGREKGATEKLFRSVGLPLEFTGVANSLQPPPPPPLLMPRWNPAHRRSYFIGNK